MRARRGERGFTLVEIMIATAIAGILFAALAQMIMTWAKFTVRAALKARTAEIEIDLRRLTELARIHYSTTDGFPKAGPWPAQVPAGAPVAWTRPAPGFDELGWAPTRSPVWLQYNVDGWSTGFIVSAVGDPARTGHLQVWRVWGDVNMFEGPLPYP